MVERQNIAHDFFLLMGQLFQLKSPRIVKSVFIQSVNSLTKDFSITDKKTETHPEPIEISTIQGNYGFFYANTSPETIGEEFSQVFTNAINMLAVILEKLQYQNMVKEKLGSKERQMETLLSNLPGMAYRCKNTQNWTMEFVSDGCRALTGYEPEDLINDKTIAYGNIIHPDDSEKVWEKVQESLTKEDYFELEYRIITKGQKEKWVWERGVRVAFDENNTEIIEGFISDITEGKKAELKLRENEENLRTTLNSIGDAVIATDINGNIVRMNPEAQSLTEWKFEDAKGHSLTDIVHIINTHSRKPIKNPVTTVIKSGDSVKLANHSTLITKHGREIHISDSATPINDRLGNIQGVVFVFRDVSEEYKKQQKIQESEARYRNLIHYSPDAIFVNHNDRISLVNIACLRLFGAETEEDLTEKSVYELFHPDYHPYVKERIHHLREKAEPVETMEEKIIKLDGSVVDVEVNAAPFPAGDTYDIHVILRDITERKRYENQIKKSSEILKKKNEELQATEEELMTSNEELRSVNDKLEKQKKELEEAKEKAEESDRLKSAFLANMSHEIRTPMNGILGFVNLLKRPNLSGEKQEKYITMIQQSGNRMINTINDLIDISKVEAGQVTVSTNETNINEQLEYLYSFFKPQLDKKNIHFSYHTPLSTEKAILQTDKEKLYAALTNLIKNAIKYTNEGSIEFGYQRKGDFIEFFIKDTGIGIPRDKKNKIFDRFIQADSRLAKPYEGAGLGLAISQAYVKMLGGEIWVESEEGKGSEFYFTIPYNPPEKISTENMQKNNFLRAPEKLKEQTVLIAEDDEAAYIYLYELLESTCKKIIRTKTGTETVKAVRENTDIALILMDIKMPETDGYEATRQIRAFNNTVTIIAQTAYAHKEDRKKALEAGCDEYIAKPIDENDLFAIIEKTIK